MVIVGYGPRDGADETATCAFLPPAGRVVPEKAHSDVREVFLRSYRIVYRVREGSILVLTVFEGRRLFPAGATDAGDE